MTQDPEEQKKRFPPPGGFGFIPPGLPDAAVERMDEVLNGMEVPLTLAESIRRQIALGQGAEQGLAQGRQRWAHDNPKRRWCPACNKQYDGTFVVCRHCGTLLLPLAAMPVLEATAGEFELQRCLGEGTLTTVYAAKWGGREEEVVVKLLRPALLGDQKTIKRFTKSAEPALRLQHPNIVKTFAICTARRGTDPFLIPCLVTEKINGPNLKQLLVMSGTMAPYVVATNMINVCSALQYAFSEGISHYDLKPSNIYFSTEPKGLVVKVVDFGLAERLFRNLEWSAPPVTDGRTTSIYGDPAFTSPEVAFEGLLSAESEIYSLGCIMYNAVTGIDLFLGNNHFDTIVKHKENMPPPLDRGSVPAKMETIIMKCLEKDPQNRYHSFDDLKDELQQFVQEPAQKK